MVRRWWMLVLLWLWPGPPASLPHEVVMFAPDGVTVHARLYQARRAAKTTIVLFHQTGSNKAEYDAVAPVLTGLGCDALTVDLRLGGTMWNQVNETWRDAPGTTDPFVALRDMDAGVSWALARGAEHVLIWGSSFTAGLVFVLAARRPGDVSGVLAFSPAEYFPERPDVVRRAATRLRVPTFVAASPREVAPAREVITSLHGRTTVSVAAHPFGHGTGLLGADRVPFAESQDVWRALVRFLAPLCGPPVP